MKAAAIKAVLIASLAAADPIGSSRRVVSALAAKSGRSQMPDEDVQLFRGAFADDMEPLGAALWQAMQTADPIAFRAGLRKLAARMGDFTDAPNLGEAMSVTAADALIKGADPKPASKR